MEIELKYTMSPAAADKIAASEAVQRCLTAPLHTIYMHAVYYDTADASLSREKAALRLRYEGDSPAGNGGYICCLKRSGKSADGLSHREEYECPAADLKTGLLGLASVGAPADLLDRLACAELVPVAEVRCVRRTAELVVDGTVMELCLDQGGFPDRNGIETPFCELELELKDGDEAVLRAFGTKLASDFGLEPEDRSKFVRAKQVRM